MTNKLVTRFLLAGLLTLGAAACGDDDSTTPDGGSNIDASVAGDFTHFVTNTIAVGNPPTMVALDINNDGTVDNKVGTLLFLAGTQGLDVQSALQASITSGSVVLLHSAHATSLTSSATATWQIYIGTPFSGDAGPPDLNGGGTFTISSSSPTNAIVSGSIAAGKFTTSTTGTGTVPLQLQLNAAFPPLTVTLHSAKVEANVTATTCTGGKLGGGILHTDLETTVFPALAALLNPVLQANECNAPTLCEADAGTPPETCETTPCCDATQCLYFSLFDVDKDGEIEASDLANPAGTVGGLLTSDLDLDDNGTPEAVSIGIGFTCTDANFDAANEE